MTMANPQKEDGYTPIANEIVDALCKINVSPYESRVLWFLFRKTYGWAKKTDAISLSSFTKHTGIDRRNVHRAIKGLSSKQMIAVIGTDDRKAVSYQFQKDYTLWRSSVQTTGGSVGTDDKDSVGTDTHKRKKERKEKNTHAFSLPEWFSEKIWKEFLAHRRKIGAGIGKESYDRMLAKFERWNNAGWNPERVLDRMVEKGWRSFNPEWAQDPIINGPQPQKGPDSHTLEMRDLERQKKEKPDEFKMDKGMLTDLVKDIGILEKEK